MKDGTCKINPGEGNPDIVSLEGIPDNALQLIRVLRENAKEIVMVAFSTHADVIKGSKYCTDWPDYLADNLNRAFGGEADAPEALRI